MKKTDKEILRNYVKTSWNSESMVDYIVKNTSEFAILDNDAIIVLIKPEIKKSFGFGYSTYGGDDYESAVKMTKHAKQEASYFISENLKANLLEKSEKYVAYMKHGEGKMFFYIPLETYEKLKLSGKLDRYSKCGEPYFLSDSENEKLNAAIDKANESFKKRLNTYLKKYGLSNVNSCTYWRDL